MSDNGYATPEALFSEPFKRKFTDVEVDGHKFRLRSWTSLESSRWRIKNLEEPESTNERAIVLSCVNADGELIFSEDHIAKLQAMGTAFVSRLADKCAVNAGMIVETKKNSDETS